METGQQPSAFGALPVLDHLRHAWRPRSGGHPAAEVRALPVLKTGAGQPLLAFPMFGAGPESTAPLRESLGRAGFHCHDWGYGNDTGPRTGSLRKRVRRLEELVIDIFETEREPVTLLGWGFSGLYAREIAKRAAPLVRQVITLGTPFNATGAPCAMLQPLHDASGRLPAAVQQQLREHPPVPCTSIYTMSDALVPWQMCIGAESPTCENILVPAHGHRGLADHPMVREIIADRLAQPEDEWRPYGA
jgi:pimeloyl-ACP methyl ester carboxylesterase